MRRHLTAKIAVAALQAIAPQWFLDPESTQRQLDYLGEQLDDTRANYIALNHRVSAQHARFMAFARASAERERPSKAG